ncbi:DNA repair protein RadA [uncultured Veillonella sp.]|uniref:DNA repair protein RadA n=1 Tax=uncultured Veillonella sp. TaxID=159268 RepID=UPI0025F51D83|nr:DNA repair protein RadA [uncultured Veillonella sp.]MDY3973314.1 DNA repair protein RadA [Veillonella caviae]
MAKVKTMYFCNNCGAESPRWLGKCPQCGQWNTLVEEVVRETSSKGAASYAPIDRKATKPVSLADIRTEDAPRMSTSYGEIDRVLGGGIVPGALMLLGGDPGIGKSTLLLQVSGAIADKEGYVLYASGEESQMQLKLRAERLQIKGKTLSVMADTNLDSILQEAAQNKPKLLVIDSIQTMFTDNLDSAPGSVAQVRECTARLLRFAKEQNVPVIIIGHVTKDGNIAGPRMLEHMVDVVLYFEGERSYQFRILRSIKNRFGSTSETGLFVMEEEGLVELLNPSATLLAERTEEEVGSAVMAYLEGIRPILVEVQSLVATTAFGMPRRTSIGYDLNRLIVLLAVLEKRCNFNLGNKDVYINVIGGLKVNEPACDLSVAAAIVSTLKNQPVPADMVILGEIGLTGNIRSIPRIEQRIMEAAKMGFTKFIVPKGNTKQLKSDWKDITIHAVTSVEEAMRIIF